MLQVSNELLSILTKKGPKIAFHGKDADGIISAAIVCSLDTYSNNLLVPLGIQQIKTKEILEILLMQKWKVILDLPPFNIKKINLYCDHHLSNKYLKKNSEIVLYDPKAPSTASLLIDFYKNRISDDLFEVGKLTEITDTANYQIPPLTSPINKSATKSELAWLLHDLVAHRNDYYAINDLICSFAKEGVNKLLNFKNWDIFQDLYIKRKKTRGFTTNVDSSDCLVINNLIDNYDEPTIYYDFFKKGTKVICFIKHGKKLTVSLRVNPFLAQNKAEKLRVDKLGEKFEGGGHMRAAGGFSSSMDLIKRRIRKWSLKKDMKCKFLQLK